MTSNRTFILLWQLLPITVNRTLKQLLRRTVQRHLVRKNGFWFVDIPRTSSTSLGAELGLGFGSFVDKASDNPWKFPPHTTARDMRDVLGPRLWSEIFTFTVVRNPWSRQVSFYHYARNCGYFQDLSFRDYVFELDRQFRTGVSRFTWHGPYFGCTDYILDENGHSLVDYIAKIEDRETGLRFIGQRLELKGLGKLFLQRQTPTSAHYSDFFDSETQSIIGSIYKTDIELFEYEFVDSD